MKKRQRSFLSAAFAACFCLGFAGCGGDGGSDSPAPVVYAAGDIETVTVDGVSFTMIYVPGGKTFPTGLDDMGTATVANAYWIGETEATYELLKKVCDWAAANKYSFENPGAIGSSGTGSTRQPATGFSWYDALVFCNALTEWYNAKQGTGYACVYTYSNAVIRDSRAANKTACEGAAAGAAAKGFRLLTNSEWELAARWRNDAVNTVAGYTNPYFTKGDSASGATANSDDPTATGSVAVYKTASTAAVKSKTSNSLGLYDMSGNVSEWCFDPSHNNVLRGGDITNAKYFTELGVGYTGGASYDTGSTIVGFRFGKTE